MFKDGFTRLKFFPRWVRLALPNGWWTNTYKVAIFLPLFLRSFTYGFEERVFFGGYGILQGML